MPQVSHTRQELDKPLTQLAMPEHARPVPYGFMREDEARLEKYLGQVTQAQLIAIAP
jgi:hypothetical protein